jgi:hypothetical protein
MPWVRGSDRLWRFSQKGFSIPSPPLSSRPPAKLVDVPGGERRGVGLRTWRGRSSDAHWLYAGAARSDDACRPLMAGTRAPSAAYVRTGQRETIQCVVWQVAVSDGQLGMGDEHPGSSSPTSTRRSRTGYGLPAVPTAIPTSVGASPPDLAPQVARTLQDAHAHSVP